MQKIYVIIFFFLMHSGGALDIDKELMDKDKNAIRLIYGDKMGDQLGRCVQMNFDGSLMAIGIPFDDGNGTDAGQVKTYRLQNGKWAQFGKGINGLEKGELFGSTMSLDSLGLRLAVGAPFCNTNGHDTGQVRIYEWQNGEWAQIGNSIGGKVSGELFGSAVSLSSDGMRLAIGAPYNDTEGRNSGQVKVYELQDGAWKQLGKDIKGNKGEQLGIAISLDSSGYRLAMGAPFDSGKDTNGGKVKVVEWRNGAWIPMGNPIYGRVNGDLLGSSVSLSSNGSIMAINALRMDKERKEFHGRVEVYTWKHGRWNALGNNIYGAVGKLYGYALDLNHNGHSLAIGTPSNYGSISGNVQMYQLLNGDWSLKRELSDEASGGLFGNAISLSGNGSSLAIGAPFDNVNGQHSGKVKVISLRQ